MIAIAVLVCGGLFVVGLLVSAVGTMDTEARLRTAIEAKQKDNTSEFDNMYKKINQVAQVSEKQMNSLKDIFVSHAQGRAGENGQGGAMMNWIKESIPNVDVKTFENLQNIITSSRDSWTMRQKELVDLDRERRQMFRTVYSGMVLSLVGRRENDVTITVVTSSRTEKSFETGKDNDTNVFQQ
jgi:hypothetical protein